jgi:hypothetical protein
MNEPSENKPNPPPAPPWPYRYSPTPLITAHLFTEVKFEEHRTARIVALCKALETASDVQPVMRFVDTGRAPQPPTPYRQILAHLNNVMASKYEAPPEVLSK